MNTMLPHLLAETSCVEDFLRLLAEEAQAMENGRFAELPALTEQKTALLDRVATLDRARESAQVALGFGPGRAGAEAAAAADGEASQQAWSALLALADRARDNNRRNGSMVCAPSRVHAGGAALHAGRRATLLRAGRHPQGRGRRGDEAGAGLGAAAPAMAAFHLGDRACDQLLENPDVHVSKLADVETRLAHLVLPKPSQ